MRCASLLLAFGIVLVAACDRPATTAPIDDRPEAVAYSTVAGARVIKGSIGPGSLYGLYLPATWNGELVLYAHGFRPTVWPIVLPDSADPTVDPRFAALRDSLLQRGFALAWSSFSENGFRVQDAVSRTRQLVGLFTSRFARPTRTYLWGFSLGSAVVVQLAEQNPGLFAGVLTECGLVMGVMRQVNHKFDTRVLFDYYFPGVIPGSALHFPPEVNFAAQVQPQLIAALMANPAAAVELAGIDQVELQYATFAELVQTLVTSFTFSTATWWTGDLYKAVNGKPFFDNTAVTYTGSANDALLNLGVQRHTAHPSTLNEWYAPRGRLAMPMLSIQTRRDPQVPTLYLSEYAALVEQAGSSQLLLQRVVDRFGHCAFTVQEEVAALDDLAGWVRSGVRPAP